jgi:hypothetical protein
MASTEYSVAARAAAYRSGPRRSHSLVFALAVLALLCAVCAPFFVDLVDHRAPPVRAGLADYPATGR